MTRTSALYEFGDFALDVGQQRLLRRDTGEAIAAHGKGVRDARLPGGARGARRWTRTCCCARSGRA